MTDVIQFVDSISATPTLRLDLNDGATWSCTAFDPGMPRLRRAMSNNAMTDGISVSSSTYDGRTLKLTLALVTSTEDLSATEVQKLARELDRTDNFLKYQPTGATKPVFFRTFRSDVSQLEFLTGAPKAFKKPTIEILAEPFALGLRETIGPFTVNNDPAAAGGCYFDVTGVIGDVAAPAVYVDSSSLPGRIEMGVRQHDPTNPTFFTQAESLTLGTDTTNPGGGPDAVMSGTGTNNFVRTSFATATDVVRLTWDLPTGTPQIGRYRILAALRRSDATSVIKVKAYLGTQAEPTATLITLPLTTNRILVDIGMLTYDLATRRTGGLSAPLGVAGPPLYFNATRTSGAGTLDWDVIFLVPADEAYLRFENTPNNAAIGRNTFYDLVIDGGADAIFALVSGQDPFAGGNAQSTALHLVMASAGSIPRLVPNQTNKIVMITHDEDGSGLPRHTKADSEVITVHYWPQYLFVRPSAT